MSCNITASIGLTCADQRQAAGVQRRFWLGNLSDLQDSAFTEGVDGYVTAISFEAYAGLYAFVGPKKGHSFSTPAQIEDGSNKMFLHQASIKLFSSNPTDDEQIESLLTADLFAIFEDNNQEFFLLGGEQGMEVTDIQRTTQTDTGDTAFNISLQGVSKNLPLRVFDTDYATTKALLESYEV